MKGVDQRKNLSPNSAVIVCNYGFNSKVQHYSTRVKAICHPFRKTDKFPKNTPTYLLSESDFCDKRWICADDLSIGKKYDITYFTLDSRQGSKCKGFSCIPMLTDLSKELGIRVRVIDYSPPKYGREEGRRKSYAKDHPDKSLWKVRDVLKKCREQIRYESGSFTESQLNRMVQESRISFFPNTLDASPRMIPESLIRGVPVIVNKNIWGGWKYVNEQNGCFFRFPQTYDEYLGKQKDYKQSAKKAITSMLEKDLNPLDIKSNYYKDYGMINASKALAKVFNDIHGVGKRFEYAFYKEFGPHMSKVIDYS